MPIWYVIETDHPDAPLVDIYVRHRCTLIEPLAGRRWRTRDRNAVLGEVEAGQERTFTVEVVWVQTPSPNDTILSVRSKSPALEPRLLEVAETEEGVICQVAVTVPPGHEGLIYAPITLHSAQHSASYWIIAVVR